MSKASEWARARPARCVDDEVTVATVDELGMARIGSYDAKGDWVVITIGPARILKIAEWALATFGEGDAGA